LLPAAGFAASFLAVGAGYWPVPYARLSFENLVGPGLAVVVVCSFSACFATDRRVGAVALWIAAAVPAVAMARVLFDVARDATSHNLWPLELVLAALVGLAAALPGAALGFALRWLRRRRAGGR
jgi:hypothetical protein